MCPELGVDTFKNETHMCRLLKIVGLFCKRALQKRQYSAKETYNFKEPINRSHPMACSLHTWGGYDEQAPENYRSLLQNVVSFVGLFCKILRSLLYVATP